MIKRFTRLIFILYIITRYSLLDHPIKSLDIKLLRIFVYLNPFYYLKSNRKKTYGERLRIALERLGPIFVKFGQALSVRQDMLSADIISEIRKLQDDVPAFPGDIAKEQIEKSLKSKTDDIFKDFDSEPLASASVAQVHTANLLSGEDVVIKVVRPGINKILKLDTSLMLISAKILSLLPSARRFKLVETTQEITQSFFDELDLLREAANASQLKRNFKDSTIHYVPKIYWKYTTQDVLTMERVSGVNVSDTKRLDELGVDRKLLAERGIQIFYYQVFNNCFFHADMHPGNMFIDVSNPADPKYISIDFGIIGTLDREDQRYLAGNFLAFFNRDYKKVAELHIESGWVPSNTRVDVLESAIRTVSEPIFEKPIKDVSLGITLMRLFQVAKRFNMEIQPQLTLLQKTLISIEGIGQTLYPELNIWETSKPILEAWMKEQIGLKGFYHRSKATLPKVSEKLPELPELIFDILEYTKHNSRNIKDKPQVQNKKSSLKLLSLGSIMLVLGFVYKDKNISTILTNFLNQNSSYIITIGAILVIYKLFRRD